MEKDGVELNLLMFNFLINVFGVVGKYVEVFLVFDYILEVVCVYFEQIVEVFYNV